MKEYKLTNDETVIIDIARNEWEARKSGAYRLGCAPGDLRVLSIKNRPMTQREVREQAYWEKYANYLLRMDSSIRQGRHWGKRA